MAVTRSTSRDLAQIAIFAALIAALAIPGGFTLVGGVPITLQTLGVMLAGAILGPRKGTLAVAVVLVLVLCGLPLLASRAVGPSALFAGHGSGYALGWLPGAWVVGALTKKLLPRYPLWLGLIATTIGGVLVVYLCGTLWRVVRFDVPLWPAISFNGAYLPGDLLKVVVATLVAKQVHRAYPGLMGTVSRSVRPSRSLVK